MSKSMKALALAGVLSLAAASAAQATEGPPTNTGSGNGHASAAPVCDGTVRSQGTAHDGRLFGKQCPLLANDGPPTGTGSGNGRSSAELTDAPGIGSGDWHPLLAGGRITGSDFHANAAPACYSDQCPVVATDGPPGSAGDKNGRAELVIDIHSMIAGGKVVGSDFHASAAPACDTEKCPTLPTEGPPSGPGDNNGRSQASNTTGEWHPVLASDGSGNINDGNGRTAALVTGDWHPVLATDGPDGPGDDNGRSGARLADDTGPGNPGDHNGRSSAALSQGGAEFLVAGGRIGIGGEV